MSHACCGEADRQTVRRNVGVPWAADGLSLAASPTFAIMALATIVRGGDAAAMICTSAHGSALSGMATMYLLMSAFHAAPWLRLVRGTRRSGGRIGVPAKTTSFSR